MPDPQHPGRRKKVYLIAFIDDATRYVVGSRFFFDENRPRLEEVLKWAVIRHGIPDMVHCDNGGIYASHYLTRVCAELGTDLRHSRPYRPSGKGYEKPAVMRSKSLKSVPCPDVEKKLLT